MKIKNILIIGLGSIGNKHLQILKKINDKIDFFIIKKRDTFKNIAKIIDSYALKLAIISSPADTHLDYINFLKKKKINYLVEKPIIKDSQLKLFEKTYNKNPCITEIVGYQLRYSKVLNRLKKILSTDKIGRIHNIKIVVNSYLPSWRKAPLKNPFKVAVKIPVAELNVKLLPDLGPKLPVAAVANNGKHVVSEDSSATVTVVAIAAVPVVDAAISSVCVVTNVCIWSAVAKPVPALAIAPVTIASEGIGPVPFVIVNWFDVVVWTAVRSPVLGKAPNAYISLFIKLPLPATGLASVNVL